jgi:hypothetical protein
MFSRSLIKRYFLYAVMIGVGVLIGVQLMGAAAASPPASAEGAPAQTTDVQVDPLDPSAIKWYTCTPANVATYLNRVHVMCTVPDGAIWYFAAPTSDYKNAARVLSLLLTAEATGKSVTVLYDTLDTSGTAYDCLEADCRPILAVATP